MAKLNMDSGHISGLSGIILGTFFSIATSVLGGMILAHIVAWRIAVVLLAAVPVMLLAGYFRLRILAKAQERHETAYNAAAALVSTPKKFYMCAREQASSDRTAIRLCWTYSCLPRIC